MKFIKSHKGEYLVRKLVREKLILPTKKLIKERAFVNGFRKNQTKNLIKLMADANLIWEKITTYVFVHNLIKNPVLCHNRSSVM